MLAEPSGADFRVRRGGEAWLDAARARRNVRRDYLTQQLFLETTVLSGLDRLLSTKRLLAKAAFKYELSASAAERIVFRKG